MKVLLNHLDNLTLVFLEMAPYGLLMHVIETEGWCTDSVAMCVLYSITLIIRDFINCF